MSTRYTGFTFLSIRTRRVSHKALRREKPTMNLPIETCPAHAVTPHPLVPLPRITADHAAWCECGYCGHIWLNRHTADGRHRELYGRD